MTRKLCYIAGPYGAPTEAEVVENIHRATQLGAWACEAGWAPLVPHVLGRAGLYGHAFEADDGTSRRNALECGMALAAGVARSGGALFIIRRQDGSLSEGTKLELDAFLSAAWPDVSSSMLQETPPEMLRKLAEELKTLSGHLIQVTWDRWSENHGVLLRRENRLKHVAITTVERT